MSWGVRTDYSGLTPYVPPHQKHTRLSEGPLTELVPSNSYGPLLPYSNVAVMPDGSLRASRYGLVTMDGMVVTDLVFSYVERAVDRNYSYSTGTAASPLPAYSLAVDIPGTEMWWGAEWVKAACALDGSWITPFEFVEIIFTENAMILMRSYETFDIDIYDYNGRFLYNVLDSQWIQNVAHDTWPGTFSYNASEGIAYMPSIYGEQIFIEILTGETRLTTYTGVFSFSDGLASVSMEVGDTWEYPDLWGFIDRDFNLVIPPRYTYPGSFINGHAVVETPSRETHVIDKSGKTLLIVPRGYWLERDYAGQGYSAHSLDGDRASLHYTEELVEIKVPENARSSGYYYINRHGGGWYSSTFGQGATLFSRDETFFFGDIVGIIHMDGDHITYYAYDDTQYSYDAEYGVRTLDGRDIIAPEKGISITPVIRNGLTESYIINTQSGYMYFGGEFADYSPSVYRLVGVDGEVLVSGFGELTYDSAEGLYKVLGIDYFAWLDMDGNTIISIPHMSYTMD